MTLKHTFRLACSVQCEPTEEDVIVMEEDDICVIPPDAYQRIEEEIDELIAEHAEQAGRTRQSTGTSEPSSLIPLVQRDTSFITRGVRIPYESNSCSSISSGARAQGLNLIAEAAMSQGAEGSYRSGAESTRQIEGNVIR